LIHGHAPIGNVSSARSVAARRDPPVARAGRRAVLGDLAMRIAGSSRRWEWRGQRLAVARVAAIAYREVAPAAFVMSCSTSSGWETMATWLVAISTLVAPMRGANCRWASGGIA